MHINISKRLACIIGILIVFVKAFRENVGLANIEKDVDTYKAERFEQLNKTEFKAKYEN